MGQLFTGIYDLFKERKWLFVFFLLLVLGFIGWFGSRILFEEDINRVIPASEKNRKLVRVLESSGFADRLVICISQNENAEQADPDLLIEYAEALMDSLRGADASPYIAKIEGQFGQTEINNLYALFYRNLPLLLDSTDYREISGKLNDSAIRRAIQTDYEALVSPGGFVMKEYILKDPLSLTPLALEKLEKLKLSENFDLYRDYIVSADRRNLLFFLIPANPPTETAENSELLSLLERYKASIEKHYDGQARAISFGSMPVSIGNADQIKADILLTVSIAIVLLIFFLGFYFRRKLVFLLLFVPAALGGGFALAMMALLRTEVSAISLGLGSVMLGISVDYALHFLSHLRHTGSVKQVIRDISQPVMVSSLTTASAFLCLLVLKSEAMRDLGLFAAFSVFSSAIFTLVILPHFFRDGKSEKARESALGKFLQRIAAFPYHSKGKLVLLIFLLFVVFLFTSRRVSFESDMESMNYMPDELIEAENYLDSISSYKLRSVFLVSMAETQDDALQQNERLIPRVEELKTKGIVRSYISVHEFYPSASLREKKKDRWKSFWTEEKTAFVRTSIEEAAAALGFKANTFNAFYGLLEAPEGMMDEDLHPLRETFLKEYLSRSDSLLMVTTLLKVALDDKAKIYDAFDGVEEVIVFDGQSLTSSFMEGLKDDLNTLVLLSLVVVFLILTLSFGRLELSIITFIPLLISWVFTLGIMGLLGIRFNIFNVVISTFIFGLGIDYAIFSLRGMVQEYQHGRRNLDSYKTSILLSGITTGVGIGVLIFAKHPALQSIAISAIIGILSVIFVTYVLLPRLFRFLVIHEGRYRRWPVTIRDFLFSLNTFAIFLAGITVLNLSGLILKYLIPMGTRRKKLLFHRMLSLACRVIAYGSINIRKTVRKRADANFKKPAVIICNHQSHLDTVLNIMQNPRMILLTHPWVQKSMFFGWFVRFADFLPVHEGLDPIMDQMREVAKAGYSIFVFPEGTRSRDLRIGRFHQGAFLIAEELGLDIIPVISYGSGNAMPKFEPFLKTSPVSMTTLPRVERGDPLFKDSLLATSKAFRHYMQEEYEIIRREFETPEFYRKKVIRNYLFRGPVIEWYMKVKIRLEKEYRLFHSLLPEKGEITDIGCGYGFMAYMLQMMAPGRRITGFDYDAEKISTAMNVTLKNKNIRFFHADVRELQPSTSDAFILADVLHYMPPEEQENILHRCVEQLKAGGLILLREADAAMKKKHAGTRISEFLSTRLGFNMTTDKQHKLYFCTRSWYLEVFEKLGLEAEIHDDTRLNSNLVYILKKKT